RDVRLEVFVARHGQLTAKVLDRADGIEAVIAAEGGRALVREDVAQKRFLDRARVMRRRLELSQTPADRPGDQFEDESFQQETQYTVDAVPDQGTHGRSSRA